MLCSHAWGGGGGAKGGGGGRQVKVGRRGGPLAAHARAHPHPQFPPDTRLRLCAKHEGNVPGGQWRQAGRRRVTRHGGPLQHHHHVAQAPRQRVVVQETGVVLAQQQQRRKTQGTGPGCYLQGRTGCACMRGGKGGGRGAAQKLFSPTNMRETEGEGSCGATWTADSPTKRGCHSLTIHRTLNVRSG